MSRKGQLSEHSGLITLSMRGIDLTIVMVSGLLAFAILFGHFDTPTEYALTIVIGALLSVILFHSLSVYRAWRGASLLSELRVITMAWVGVFLVLFMFAVATKSPILYSREWAALWFAVAWGFLFLFRGSLRFLLRWMRAAGLNARRIVLVGSGDLTALVDRRVKQAAWAGLQILGFFDDRKTRHSVNGQLPHLGDFAAIHDYVQTHDVHQVWLALPLRAEKAMKRVLHNLRHATVDIRFVPDIFGFNLLNHSTSEVAGMPVVNLTASPMTGINRLIKEIEDRLLAAVILCFISPLMALIALGVKLTSPGPILFKQIRHGWDGKPIKVYKFRTMKVHTEDKGRVTQASKQDPRVTSFGALLRRTSLDELPQFFNVLFGDMSIVGPRPHAVEHNEAYKEYVKRYMLRHRVKPGITGWAQINGYRGETDTMRKMEKRIQHDLYYIENWSLWFDLRIVLLSLFKGFSNQNAY